MTRWKTGNQTMSVFFLRIMSENGNPMKNISINLTANLVSLPEFIAVHVYSNVLFHSFLDEITNLVLLHNQCVLYLDQNCCMTLEALFLPNKTPSPTHSSDYPHYIKKIPYNL